MLFCWLYVLSNAASALLRQYVGVHLSPLMALLVGTLLAVGYFNLITLKRLPVIYATAWSNKKDAFFLGVLIALIWLSAMYSPAYIGASVYVFLFFGSLGWLGMWAQQKKQPTPMRYWSFWMLGVLMLLSTLYLLLLSMTGKNALGVGLALFGGLVGFAYVKYSHRLMQQWKLTAAEILAIRFYPTLLLCLILLPFGDGVHLSIENLGFGLLVGAVCLVIPVYFSQKGIEKGGAEPFAIVSSFLPMITTVFQWFLFHTTPGIFFIVYILYALCIIIPYVWCHFERRAFK